MTNTQIQYPVSIANTDEQIIKEITLKISNNKSIYLIHRALIHQLNNKRQGTAHTKTRSEIRGGGKKPWKQKGTGRARAGSIRSPLWKGGGVIFGPKNKNYNIKLNKKEKQLALRTLIYNKLKYTIIVEHFLNSINKPSSKLVLETIKNLGLTTEKNKNILIIITQQNHNLYLSTRNLNNIELINANHLNIIALLKADKLIITVDALEKINEVYNA